AGHGAVLVGDVELQRKSPAPGDGLDPPDDIGDRALAMRIGRRADVDGEGNLPRNDVGRTGPRMNGADRADEAALVAAAELLDSRDAFGRTRKRIAAVRHWHGAGMS